MVGAILSGGLVGLVFGFILQRSRFCMTGGFRDMYIARDNTLFYAFVIAITVESLGVISLWKLGYLANPYEDYSVLGAIVGSYLFGIGIVLAGGCATGTWYRAGEGLIGSWVALFFYMLSASSMKYGALKPLNDFLAKHWVISDNLPKSLGISVWYFVSLLVIISLVLVIREYRRPKPRVASLPTRYKGLRHWLFEKTYHKYWAGFAIGLIALIAWPASQATGRIGGLGITTPSANLITYATTGDSHLLNWGVFLVIGIFMGSFLAAKGAGEFRWRLPDLKTIGKSVIGGILMGIGASWAGGCTIGNGLTATAVISSKGWIALPVTILGVWTASYFIFVRPTQK
ncbi:YeeE/YedE family protein [Streptococcus saliviloxodontae]|uniref:Membrane protein YedE/YeeE n=1 Tax=Streptococcus saliviloxodontae TaxID=1349416 RepID=A0ABS2PNK8_9STRE|nr:YeeE/YedE family protein [Streptococcus saliviloxodontae]MBM7636531.1 putative membrane protein YedE/YeeE [Streptococcus saliviloxodontae]